MKKQWYARRWLDKHLMKAHSSALRLKQTPSPEAVHDFRVALRRVRTLMKAYQPFLDKGIPAKSSVQIMKDAQTILGDIHDLICLKRYVMKRRAEKNGILVEALQTEKQILFEKNKKMLFSTPQKLKDQLDKL